MDIRFITVQTNKGDELDNWLFTAKSHGYNHHVIGLGEKWGGWTWRTKKYLEYVKTLPETAVPCLLDCNDVYFIRPYTDFLTEWLKYVEEGKRLVFGGESTCCTGEFRYYVSPSKRKKAIETVQSYEPDSRWMFPNAGCVIGFRDNIIEMLELSKDAEDDQAAYLKQYLDNKDWLSIDYKHSLFGNINSLAFFYKMDYAPTDYYNAESQYWEIVKQYPEIESGYLSVVPGNEPTNMKMLKNKITGGSPPILHFPGKNFVLYNYYGKELYGGEFIVVSFTDVRKTLWSISYLWK